MRVIHRRPCYSVWLSSANLLLFFFTTNSVCFSPPITAPYSLKMANPPSIQAGSTLSHLAEGSLAARGVDIIFIHALLGNTCGTWTTTEQKGKSQTANRWLWDLLPADLPSSRIYTYGCRPKALCHDWDIHKVADQLLVELTDLRADKAEVRSFDIWLPSSFRLQVLWAKNNYMYLGTNGYPETRTTTYFIRLSRSWWLGCKMRPHQSVRQPRR